MNNKRTPKILIIGAGMTGILMVIKLREAGFSDIRIIEKSDRLGGTWRENTYPGVACDIPAHMYTYSVEPNAEWSHRYAHGDEIQAYFERVARKYGVINSIQFNEAVESSIYNEGRWEVKTSKAETYSADFVINCTGILHHPSMPSIPGLEDFAGAKFHSARWDHSVDLKGKRIGIIGTGSTACQIVPELSEVAEEVVVFQRTPHWLFPSENKKYSAKSIDQRRRNPNKIRRLRAAYEFYMQEFLTKAVTGAKIQNFIFSNLCRAYLKISVKDPVLRAKLTPDYRPGCKRVIISSKYYPALQRDNVNLCTDGVEKLTDKGVQCSNGEFKDLDVVVLATGFQPTAYMRPMDMRGEGGQAIDEAWKDKVATYRSLFMPGFPNNFLMLGPNTPIGNYSVIAMSEVQCGYILKVLEQWQEEKFDAIDAKPEAAAKFMDYMKLGLKNTVWVGGCNSWYLDQDGDPILWPYTWKQWEKEMAVPDYSDFNLKTFS